MIAEAGQGRVVVRLKAGESIEKIAASGVHSIV